MHIDKEMLLKNVSIEDACRVNGIAIKRRNQILCPAHMERMGKANTRYGNCLIYPESRNYKCHSCGAGGDVISLTMAARHCDFPEAMAFLAETLCPGAISDENEWRQKAPKVRPCPLSAEELTLIGLRESRAQIPVSTCISGYFAKHPDETDPWAGMQPLSILPTDSNCRNMEPQDEILICKEERYTPLLMYEEDQTAFWFMVKGKAESTLSFCRQQKEQPPLDIPVEAWKEFLLMKEDAADHAIRLCRKNMKNTI